MTNNKSTKRSLLKSALALLLAVSMLIGCTFAWFTDAVTSKGNIIQSGELDLEMYWTDDLSSNVWYNVEDAAHNTIFGYNNWEPGYTDVKYIKLVNNGNLALDYKLMLTPKAQVGKLAEVINVYFAEDGVAVNTPSDLASLNSLGKLDAVLNGDATAAGTLLAAGQQSQTHPSGEIVMTIALNMDTTAGNEYQGKDAGEFTITAIATQTNFESDSFGDNYDADAEFPTVLEPSQISAAVTVVNGVVAEAVTLQGNGISASVPAGVAVKEGTESLVLSITPLEETTSDIDVAYNDVFIPVDVHIEGVAENNTVPIVIELGEILPKHLNMGNYSLIHVEDGANQAMTRVDSAAELTVHNTYTYDSATGAVSVAMASFSEVALLADTTNVWQGSIATKFAGGSGTAESPYLIANADQLALLNERVSNENETYGGACYRLIADINLGSGANGVAFYPIGYHKVGGTNDAGESWYTYGGAFSGVFDGYGHIISGLYQRTWDMAGDYDDGYWNDAMGLFGYVYNGTVKNLVIDHFFSEGEFVPTGCVTAYAAGASTFENIAIINSHPQTYNTGVAGIIGWDNGGDTEEEASNFTFKYITVDETTTVSALWGSWDVGAAGILGYLGTYSTAKFENCHVSATIDVYNDVCGNYQYYWYRYCGAYIGTVDRRLDNGNGALDLSNVTAENCTVAFGDRHEYYYCEFEKNSQASYTDDYQFSRVDHSELVFAEDGTVTCTHEHTANEDKQAVYIPFRQLFGGYGWGVDGVDVEEYVDADGKQYIDISTVTKAVEKFEAADTLQGSYKEYNKNLNNKKITIGELFNAKAGADIRLNNVRVTVSPADSHSTVTGTYVSNTTDWTRGTLALSGVGDAIITITDYSFCLPTTVKITVESLNYITNGDFSGTSLTHWNTAFVSKNYAQVTTLEDGNAVLEMLPSETKWNGYLKNVPLEANTKYRITFRVKGAPLDFYIYKASSGSAWRNLLKDEAPESTEWKEYSYTFTTNSTGDDNWTLSFARGGNIYNTSKTNTASLGTENSTYIDDVKLVKVTK